MTARLSLTWTLKHGAATAKGLINSKGNILGKSAVITQILRNKGLNLAPIKGQTGRVHSLLKKQQAV